jgi:hypothetical protein
MAVLKRREINEIIETAPKQQKEERCIHTLTFETSGNVTHLEDTMSDDGSWQPESFKVSDGDKSASAYTSFRIRF